MPLRVKDIMTKDVISIELGRTVYEAVLIMLKNNVGSVVVTDNGKPVGIFTDRDFMRVVTNEKTSPDRILISKLMSRPLIVVSPNSSVDEAGEMMAKYNIRRLVIVQGERLEGI